MVQDDLSNPAQSNETEGRDITIPDFEIDTLCVPTKRRSSSLKVRSPQIVSRGSSRPTSSICRWLRRVSGHPGLPTSFMELLADMEEHTSLDARQLDLLIKIDFFKEFGNQRELFRIVDLFNMFKKGQAKQIRKTVVDGSPLEPIVKKYAVGVTRSGGAAKSYTLLDVMSILKEAEEAIRNLHMDDLDDITKVRNFYDVMGYIGYVSGKPEDRRKLYVTGVKPLHRSLTTLWWVATLR